MDALIEAPAAWRRRRDQDPLPEPLQIDRFDCGDLFTPAMAFVRFGSGA